MSNDATWISVDWGTSSFRATLRAGDGGMLSSCEAPRGILTFQPQDFEPLLEEKTRDWRRRGPDAPIIMSGMIGARQGWREAPYAKTPAGVEEIAAAILSIETRLMGVVRVIPGVVTEGSTGAPDVMRGEETQILGALAATGAASGIFVLPGTHSKWVEVGDGRIQAFRTFMTGEIFAALKAHTILARLMTEPSPEGSGEGFARGVEAARRFRDPGDLLNAVFMTRTLGLFDRLPGSELAEYLSGLLIAAEIRSGAAGATIATAVGASALVSRYRRAGDALGVEIIAAPEDCAALGQAAILRALPRSPNALNLAER